MQKIMRIGTLASNGYNGKRQVDLFIKATIKDGKLSITGVIGPQSNGNADGGRGQIDMEFAHRDPKDDDKRYSAPIKPDEIKFAPNWTADKWLDLLDVWQRWHLNDMRASCEHQTGPEWDTRKELVVQRYAWGDNYHSLRRSIEDCTSKEEIEPLAAELAQCNAIFALMDLHGYTSTGRHCWPDGAEALLAKGFIKPDKTETKTAGWVYPKEHPEGLLCKPCPVCGYKYGSACRKEELPASVVAFLQSLPDTDKTPAWV